MYYKVTAQFKTETAKTFQLKLTDGTNTQQKPDGMEIVESMKPAVVTEKGTVQCSEVCYCSTPLSHERTTVLDRHFDNIITEEIEGHIGQNVTLFMSFLEELLATGNEGRVSESGYRPTDKESFRQEHGIAL